MRERAIFHLHMPKKPSMEAIRNVSAGVLAAGGVPLISVLGPISEYGFPPPMMPAEVAKNILIVSSLVTSLGLASTLAAQQELDEVEGKNDSSGGR